MKLIIGNNKKTTLLMDYEEGKSLAEKIFSLIELGNDILRIDCDLEEISTID